MKRLTSVFLSAALMPACTEARARRSAEADAATPNAVTPDAASPETVQTTSNRDAALIDTSPRDASQPTNTSSKQPSNGSVDSDDTTTDAGSSNDDDSTSSRADAGAIDTSTNGHTTNDAGGSPSSTTMPDAEATTERFCSDDPLDTVAWECKGDDCSGTPLNLNKCPLLWDCNAYPVAIDAARDHCVPSSVSIIATEACEHNVIERRVDESSLVRAFYSPNGELVGAWSLSQNSEQPERCSGTIPTGCLEAKLDALVAVQLCNPSSAAN